VRHDAIAAAWRGRGRRWPAAGIRRAWWKSDFSAALDQLTDLGGADFSGADLSYARSRAPKLAGSFSCVELPFYGAISGKDQPGGRRTLRAATCVIASSAGAALPGPTDGALLPEGLGPRGNANPEQAVFSPMSSTDGPLKPGTGNRRLLTRTAPQRAEHQRQAVARDHEHSPREQGPQQAAPPHWL